MTKSTLQQSSKAVGNLITSLEPKVRVLSKDIKYNEERKLFLELLEKAKEIQAYLKETHGAKDESLINNSNQKSLSSYTRNLR